MTPYTTDFHRGECENCGDWARLHAYGVLRLCRPCLDKIEAEAEQPKD